jgi:protein-export membrane protein SecD
MACGEQALMRRLALAVLLLMHAAPATAAGVHMVLKVDVAAQPAAQRRQVMAQTVEIVRRRLGNLDIAAPKVVRSGSDRIVADVSNYADVDQLRRLFSSAHLASFRRVDEDVKPDDIRAGRIPPGVDILPGLADGNKDTLPLAVYRAEAVGGERIVDAQEGESSNLREPMVTFRLDDLGKSQFAEFTRDNVGRRFAIVLDGKVVIAPTIEEMITGGSGQITGHFTAQGAHDLAISLRAGAAPAQWSLVRLERTP